MLDERDRSNRALTHMGRSLNAAHPSAAMGFFLGRGSDQRFVKSDCLWCMRTVSPASAVLLVGA